MSNMLHEPARDLPVLAEYDVVVCGGGPAGCAAAIAAARQGAKTLLIEKCGYLGGATVSQLVGVVLSTNGVDFQGIWHEWAARLLAYRSMAPLIRSPSPFYPGCSWFRTSVNSEGVKRVWDEMLTAAGADILLMAHLCGACIEEGVITGIVVHTRAGLRVVRALRVIDTTGDAALCHEAGVDSTPWQQQVSLVYRMGGFQVPGSQKNPDLGGGGTSAYRPERLGRVDRTQIDPLDPFSISEAIRDMRGEIWQQTQGLPPGQYLVDSAAELGIRVSRCIHGIKHVSDDDAWERRKAPDGIARSSWEIDIHPPDKERPIPERWFHSRSEAYAGFAKHIMEGDWFDIPYGCLVTAGADNLLAGGRCISAGQMAQGSLRIQQTCMATGQAAGVAAALSLQKRVTPRELDPATVTAQLIIDHDVELAFPELSTRRWTA